MTRVPMTHPTLPETQVINVHPAAVAHHERSGWRRVNDERPAVEPVKLSKPDDDGSGSENRKG